MKKIIPILSITTFAILSVNSFAGGDNQGNAPDKKQFEHREQMRDRGGSERHDAMQNRDDRGQLMREHHQPVHEPKDIDKQHKMDQQRKELGKGSEQGQKSREEHSRKWWKFWGND